MEYVPGPGVMLSRWPTKVFGGDRLIPSMEGDSLWETFFAGS
jgi:hypothetical protein